MYMAMQRCRAWGAQWWLGGVLALCAWVMPAQADVVIKGAGATFPSRVYDRWTAQFMQEHRGVALQYQGTGSGDGIRQAKARTVHFGGTDNPLSAAQLTEHKLVQIPLLVGGFVPVVNLPGVQPNELVLSGEVLADMTLGVITRWNDARIAELNPRLSLPALPVVRVVREDKSGSTEVWVRYLADSSPAFAKAVPISQKPAWPAATLQAKGNDGVSALVKATPGGFTYVSYDRVVKDKLVGARLRNRMGQILSASEAGFRAAILASDVYRKADDAASLLNRPRPDAWPITSTSFVLLDARPTKMGEADWTARFVYWCFMHGDELTRGTGFAPLPATVQARLAGRLMQIRGPAGELTKFQ